jgi:hypothetical protein
LALLGVVAAKDSPAFTEQVSVAATWFNIVNFEIEILRPVRGGM